MAFLDRADARLFYEVCRAGDPVVFIQGIGVIGAGWKYQTDALCEEFQCLSFDNRGIGQSTYTASSLTVEQMAQDALALMDAQGWEKAHVVGHSMGGAIAQALALAAPKRVKSLSFLCTFAKGSQGTRMTPDVIKMGLRTRIGTRTMRRHAFMEMLFSPELFIIGGGVSRKSHKFLSLIEGIEAELLPAELQNNAGIVGAAMRAAKE